MGFTDARGSGGNRCVPRSLVGDMEIWYFIRQSAVCTVAIVTDIGIAGYPVVESKFVATVHPHYMRAGVGQGSGGQVRPVLSQSALPDRGVLRLRG